MENMNPEQLEKMVHAALRSLPDRRAPDSLAARVRAELERRAAIPWWHKSYVYWPRWARGTFLASAGGSVVGLLVFTGVTITTGVDTSRLGDAFKPWLAFAHRALGVVDWIGNFVSLLISSVPPLWLYGGLALVATMYVSLFGLGATAYRFLWSRR